jgi:hypothetical protein
MPSVFSALLQLWRSSVGADGAPIVEKEHSQRVLALVVPRGNKCGACRDARFHRGFGALAGGAADRGLRLDAVVGLAL